jgi:hypothetical protein
MPIESVILLVISTSITTPAEVFPVQLRSRKNLLDTRRGDYQGPSLGICDCRIKLGRW